MTKRKNLSDFAPDLRSNPAEHGTDVLQKGLQTQKKYYKLTGYVTAGEERLIKTIALEHNIRVSDIVVDALREWLQKRGYGDVTGEKGE